MSTPESRLPQPIETRPSDLIENIFPDGDTGNPDLVSKAIAEDYLHDRYYGHPNDGLPPSTILVPTERPAWLRWSLSRDRWLFGGNPRDFFVGNYKKALAVSVASLALVNAFANREEIKDLITGDEPGATAEAGPHPSNKTLSKEHFFQNDVGVETPRPNLSGFLNQLEQLRKEGAKIEQIRITGLASDEFLQKPNKGIETPDVENDELALRRAGTVVTDLLQKAEDRGINLPEIKLSFHEDILGAEERRQLETLSERFGYGSLASAISSLENSPRSLPPRLYSALTDQVAKRRGVNVSILYSLPSPEISPAPDDDDWKFLPLFIPPIPIPRRGAKTIYKKKVIPGIEPEDEWLRIYEEALNDDRTLKPDTWAYTRKYQTLFREGRINKIFQGSFTDGEGCQQILRILFVDHEPTDETLDAFSELTQSLSQIQNGEVAKFLNAIAVYPTDNTGGLEESNTPKQIGLGIDYQEERGILGLAYPGISLVEMHMPTEPSREQLKEFMGPVWTFAHEAHGHFGDLNGEAARLESITGSNRFVMTSQWADSAEGLHSQLEYERWSEQRRWLVRRVAQDLNGKAVPRIDEEVDDLDSQIDDAHFIRVENRFPTVYSATSAAELFAEGSAQAVTGIGIPFEQQPDFGNPPTDPRFATAYAIGSRLFAHITSRAGGRSEGNILSFDSPNKITESWEGQSGIVEDSEQLLQRAVESRRWDFRESFDPRILHILVPRRSNKS